MLGWFKKKEKVHREYEPLVSTIDKRSIVVFSLIKTLTSSKVSSQNFREVAGVIVNLIQETNMLEENIKALDWKLQPLRNAIGRTSGIARTEKYLNKIDKGLKPINDILSISNKLENEVVALKKVVLTLAKINLNSFDEQDFNTKYNFFLQMYNKFKREQNFTASSHYKRAVEQIYVECQKSNIDSYFDYN